MLKKIKVLAVTGIRSEYDILYPVIKRMQEDPLFEVVLAVSSAHLSEWHNFTLKKIEEDGFTVVDKLDCLFMTNRTVQRSKGVGILTYALSQTVEREKPDFLFVVGDREESIATAIIGNYMNVLTAHLGGGDPVFGNADDPIRIAVSKLAHVHFTTAELYAENLRKMKEDNFRVIFSGNPALTNIKIVEQKSIEEVAKHLSFDITDGNYVVLVKHPLSSEEGDSYEQMNVTLNALEDFCGKFNYKVVASYPNTDPGSYDILRAVREFENKSFIRFYNSLPREYFVNLMRNAKALIGNSSMGILEAPFYKLPVVNVGNRQQGRLNAGNVKFVTHHKEEIVDALKKACLDDDYRLEIKNLYCPFGDGTAPEIICETIKKIDPKDKKWLVKESIC
ncbi:MAG: UDP-N-acetylglucosamine 2-epimerase [Bacteroidia bacterium]